MRRIGWLTAAAATLLSGCGTYSFAPPDVSLTRRTTGQELAPMCGVPVGGKDIPAVEDKPTVEDALALIHNYIGAYRCTMRIAADGRQSWQLPGFAALVGSAAATALGGGTDWAIAGGAAHSMFTAGNSYYDHVKQAEILRDALDALGCVESEAVGVDALVKAPAVDNASNRKKESEARVAVAVAATRLDAAREALNEAEIAQTSAENKASRMQMRVTSFGPGVRTMTNSPEAVAALEAEAQALAEVDTARALAESRRTSANDAARNLAVERAALDRAVEASAALGVVEVSAERQFYNMIVSRLIGIEGVAAKRLADRGSFDPAGVVSQIKDLTEKAEQAEDEAGAAGQGDDKTALRVANLFGTPGVRAQVTQIRLELAALAPKLDKCVLRAQAAVGPSPD